MKILCIMIAHNEEDIIYHSAKAYIEEGIDVYLINNASTDNTVEEAKRAGVKMIENFPEEVSGYSNDCVSKFVYTDLLRRTEDIAEQFSEYDWYITSAADEFRESPFPYSGLKETIKLADQLGYNYLYHTILYFELIDNSYIPKVTDPRFHFKHYDYFRHYKRGNLTVWKNVGQRVKLCHPDGERVEFSGMKMFPIPFILRHYPIRSTFHGAKKMQERLDRYTEEEKALGWHYQYDEYKDDLSKFLKDPSTLKVYDGIAFRCSLLSQTVQDFILLLSLKNIGLLENLECSQIIEDWINRRSEHKVTCKEINEMNEGLDHIITMMIKGQSVRFEITAEEKDLFSALLDLRLAAARLIPNNIGAQVCEDLKYNVFNYINNQMEKENG